ncbi:MAG: type II toxin-antitoxin system RelE/ParE family toxin [Thermanaerothrix sp.]|jgi:mRNA-degrading endonuclease RelE of RelBE toxin-antitoxin system|uniref:Type II toxin-antitoxin system RelE/ParE family toxin n=1 Tax=Thermanaerothrix solaris TaxID=3058434 RepID=A0ABU3NIE7_9CHLR|nr:type II toxin-antitoxin system RelE/ParE family toxin [Thermanaerothrix sp. 4228-RoL]MDT8896633.1 type II toxin-antitoxin system RelE/ParE family toxin [Thermanaerothrix sp. 4228-RoL]
MHFIETTVFTRRILELMSDDEYRALQIFLSAKPDAGDIIPGSGGLRKVRWRSGTTGKRGGVRLIYYWVVHRETILFLFAFRKNERSDLTPDQLRILRRIVEEEYHE